MASRVRFLPAPPGGMRGSLGRYGPSSYYATGVWLPILGPSTFLAWRLLAGELQDHPGGVTVTIDRLAADLGLGSPRGGQAAIVRTLRRLERFGITRAITDDLVLIREELPPATPAQLTRLDDAVRARHDRLTDARAQAS
jgi:hypothetical protein